MIFERHTKRRKVRSGERSEAGVLIIDDVGLAGEPKLVLRKRVSLNESQVIFEGS